MAQAAQLLRDPRTFMPLSDGKPLMSAIPKQYLGMLATYGYYDTQGNLANRLSEGGRTIHRVTVNGWIKGTLNMSNKDVVYVAHVLGVSPLCVLDLCEPSESEASTAHYERIAMVDLLHCLSDWQKSGKRTIARNVYALAWLRDMDLDYPATAEGLGDVIRRIRGDYRDLQRLAVDAAAYYAVTCDPDKQGSLVSRIAEAGRAYSADTL